MPNTHTLHIPWKAVALMRSRIPLTHELGGEVRIARTAIPGRWAVVGMDAVEGSPCRDDHGAKLRKGTHCSIRKPDYPISFHTHPKSNAPSSADMRNSLFKHPGMLRYHGKRRLSVIFTREGVWGYYPRKDFVTKWRRGKHTDPDMRKEVRRWSAFKRRYGVGAVFLRYMRSRGMAIAYSDYERIRTNGGMELSFDE